MRIGFDAKRAASNFTGLGNYSRFLIEILAKSYPDDLFLYVPKNKRHGSFMSLFQYENVHLCLPKIFMLSALWRSFGIKKALKKDGIQVYHGLSNEIPFGLGKTAVKTVVSIHDLIFLRLPHTYRLIDRCIYKIKFNYACKHADVVIAISECTKRDIVHYFGIDPQKIKVIYQSCDSQFKKVVSLSLKEEVRAKYKLPERYILCLGSLEERKNALLVVKAMKKINLDYHLVLVGKSTSYVGKILDYAQTNDLMSRIHIVQGVKFRELPAFYQMADVFVFPSFFEGFGIPVLEALSSGIPVIAAKGSCLEEAGGPYSIYVDPTDVDGLAMEIRRVLTDDTLRALMVEQGFKYLSKFEDKKLAEELMGVYQSL